VKPAVGKLLAVAFGLCLGAVVCELVVRLLPRERRAPEGAPRERRAPEGPTEMLLDPLLGWRLRPGARVIGAGATHIEIDARGHRALPQPSHPRRRIVVVGDSIGFGYHVEHVDSFAGRLAVAHPDTEVVNLSVSGYGTDQELLYLREQLPRLEPRLPTVVVAQFCANDILDILSDTHGETSKPRFALDADGALQLVHVPGNPPTPPASERRPLGSRLRAYSLVHDALVGANQADPLPVERTRRLAAIQNGWRLWGVLMDAMQAEARRAGATLIVLEAPGMHQVGPDYRKRLAAAIENVRASDVDAIDSNGRIAEWAAAGGIAFVEVRAQFNRELAAGREIHYAADDHPNELGHALIAAALEPALERAFVALATAAAAEVP
jgi:lysophospholipase L1-like esterase